MQNRIDNINNVDRSMVTHESLTPHYGTGQAIRLPDRHFEKRYKYRNGVQTDIGDIEESVWIELAKWLVEKEHAEEHFAHILEWKKEFNYVEAKTPAQLYKEALECFIRRLPDSKSWWDYIRFNARYRPSLLDDPTLLTVRVDCCGKECKVAAEQIEKRFEAEPVVPCPLCNRASTFKIIHPGLTSE